MYEIRVPSPGFGDNVDWRLGVEGEEVRVQVPRMRWAKDTSAD